MGVPGHAEGVDEGGGKNRLLEAVGAPLAIEDGEDEPHGAEVVGGFAEVVEELAELGALFGGGFASEHPVEEAAEDAELGLLRHGYGGRESSKLLRMSKMGSLI